MLLGSQAGRRKLPQSESGVAEEVVDGEELGKGAFVEKSLLRREDCVAKPDVSAIEELTVPDVPVRRKVNDVGL